jgi:hypothetical protein
MAMALAFSSGKMTKKRELIKERKDMDLRVKQL